MGTYFVGYKNTNIAKYGPEINKTDSFILALIKLVFYQLI